MITATRKSTQLSNNTEQSFKSNIEKVNDKLFNCELKLQDEKTLSIPMRDDGYINATLLCKAAKKKFNDWNRKTETKALIQALELITGIPVIKLLHSTSGRYGGSWIHPDLAIQLAQWCNPLFAIQVSRWTRELLLYGKVNIEEKKSNDELEHKFQQQIQMLTEEKNLLSDNYKKLSIKHQSILKRRARDSYNTGSVIYILSHEAFTGQYNCDYFKIGKSAQIQDEKRSTFMRRLSTYNTGAPINYKVHYLMYLDNVDLVECCIKERFSANIEPSNKEWIKDVKLIELVKFIKNLCDVLEVEHNEIKVDIPDEMKSDEEESDEEEEKKGKKCVDCNIKITNDAQRCDPCHRKSVRIVVDRPTYEELEEKYNECGKNMTKLAKVYGVSDNAVNKWIKAYEKETGKESFKKKIKPKFKGEKPLLKQLLNDLNVLKLSYTKMAKKYNVDRSTVIKWVKN